MKIKPGTEFTFKGSRYVAVQYSGENLLANSYEERHQIFQFTPAQIAQFTY